MSRRINISLPERSVQRVEALKELTDASSATEVIKHALMTYESLAEHLSNGVTFIAQTPSGDSFTVEFMIDVPKKTTNLKVVNG